MINKEFNFMLYVTIIIDTDKKGGMSSAITWTPHRKNRCRSMCDCIYMYLASLATRICRYNSNRYVRANRYRFHSKRYHPFPRFCDSVLLFLTFYIVVWRHSD